MKISTKSTVCQNSISGFNNWSWCRKHKSV